MRLLIVGSLNGQIGAAGRIAIDRGAKVAQADSIDAALTALRAGQSADLVMVDVKLDIRSLIQSLTRERILVPVIGCGLADDTEGAVRAIRSGAREYLPLPADPELIAAVLEAVTEESTAILFKDPAVGRIVDLADQVAPSDASILITGESGTGKELLARHLHSKSRRAKEKFISVNCAAIPDNLLESELFGHERGSFTGAIARRIGKFEEAHGGTLLLDEISEMEPRLQAKLLRAIQEREIDRVGSTTPIKIDIRVIATSNRDLEHEVRKGTFREDLLYRLNVVSLHMPALRDRPADIELLAEHFARKYAAANGLPDRPLTVDARRKLLAHSWRGNVRELENTLHRAVLLAKGDEIDGTAITLNSGAPLHDTYAAASTESARDSGERVSVKTLIGRTVAEVERDLIIDTLYHCLGNRTHAATILGISIRTLRNKLKAYSEEGVVVPIPGEIGRASLAS